MMLESVLETCIDEANFKLHPRNAFGTRDYRPTLDNAIIKQQVHNTMMGGSKNLRS